MMSDMSKSMLSSSTKGPILSTVVNIDYKCTVNPYNVMIYCGVKDVHNFVQQADHQYWTQLLIICYISNVPYNNKHKMETNPPNQPKRNKELTEKELKNLRMNIQQLSISNNHNIYYSLITKDSKSGFFSNERILVLNQKDKELFYTKIPQGLIPFLNEEQVKSLKSKVKVSKENIINKEVSQFKCAPVPGKISSFLVQFKQTNLQQWICLSGNSKVMHDWVDLINKVLVLDQPKPIEKPLQKPKPVQQPKINRQQQKPKPIQQTPKPQQVKQKPKDQTQMQNESKPKAEEVIKPQEQNIQINQPLKKVPSQRITRPLEPQNQIQNIPPPLPPSQENSLGQSYGSNMQESQIANMPYSDHVSQLKYLRGEKPGLFKTNNDLSKPNLHPQQIQNNRNQQNIKLSKASSSVKSHQGPPYKENYQVNSRLIDSNADQYIPTSRLQEDSNLTSKDNYGVIQRGPSRKDLQHYRPRQQQYDQHFPNNNQNSRSRQSGVLVNNATRSRQAKQFQRESEEYLPVFSKKKTQQLSKNPSQQKNIVIKNQDSRDDIRIARDPSRSKVMSNFGSKGGSYKSLNNYNSKGSLNRKKWNQMFAQTNNKLQIYEEFMVTSFNVVRDIINELPLNKNQKQFLPIQAKSPYFTYYDQGIIITLHYFQNGKNVTTGIYSSDTPLLYDQTTYQLLKRQFYNYNLILNVTANEGFIKVPLCAYFQYKGVLALCKAQIPENFNQITPKRYEKQFDIIQNQIHVRFMYGSFNSYLHPSNKYIILDNMRELIPQIPLQNKEQNYFRKQFLLQYNQIIEDMQTCNQAHYQITHEVLPELLSRLQTLQNYIVCSSDLKRVCHSSGVSLAYLPLLIQQIKAPYVKKIFITELVASLFTSIFRSEINHLMATFPREEFDQLSLQIVNRILLDNSHTLIELAFGYSNAAQSIWKLIVEQCSQKYKVTLSKEDLIPGYLLGAIIQRFGLVCDFRRSAFNKHNVQFFVKSGNIPQDLLVGFKMHSRRYDLSTISPMIRDLQNILADEPNAQNFKLIVHALNLKQDSIPNYLQSIQPQILSYLCNFVPYSEHEQFQHIGIYNMIVLQPHSYFSVKLSLLAIKWCIKKKLTEEAFKIYQMKEIENAFWLGEYNPAISEFYDFFSMFYASLGKYQQATQLAKLSLKNINKVLGNNQLPVADKHYQLGNIYFKMGKKNESLKEYTKTKEILTSHNQVHISQYAVILFKLSVLYLNFGKISQCVNSSLQALKIFDETQQNQVDQINTFEILSRCYQITKKNNQLLRLGDLMAQKFNLTQDSQIFQRMAKIVLFARLKNLSSAQSKSFMTIITKLQEHLSSIDKTEAFTFLHRKCQEEVIMKKVINYLQNIVSLYEESSKKDLFRRYKRLDANTRTEAQQMLVVFDAIGTIIGYGYLLGSLREND